MKSEMAAFFDKMAPNWENPQSEYETREKLTSMMGLLPGFIIIDVGCGKGVMFEHLLKSNPEKIIAVDVSGEMIRLAKELFSDDRIDCINGDFFEIPLPAADIIVFFNCYPHFIDKDALVKKAASILKKGGVLVIAHSLSKSEINGFHDGERVSTLSVPLEAASDEAKKFDSFFDIDTFIDNDEIYFIKMTRR